MSFSYLSVADYGTADPGAFTESPGLFPSFLSYSAATDASGIDFLESW